MGPEVHPDPVRRFPLPCSTGRTTWGKREGACLTTRPVHPGRTLRPWPPLRLHALLFEARGPAAAGSAPAAAGSPPVPPNSSIRSQALTHIAHHISCRPDSRWHGRCQLAPPGGRGAGAGAGGQKVECRCWPTRGARPDKAMSEQGMGVGRG